MWWNGDWPLFAPLMIVFFLICLGMMFRMMRRGLMYCFGLGRGGDETRKTQETMSLPQGDTHPAFDAYRAQTLKRLEQEDAEFHGFLDRLRSAKDQAEFDARVSERRHAPE